MSNFTYYLPCKPSSIYANVTDQCLNNCLFCIRRDGSIFFGSNLFLEGKYPSSENLISSIVAISDWDQIKEVVFCGMGEPLLRYDLVLETCCEIRSLKNDLSIRVDTSGLYWHNNKRLDILDTIDILSVSLNAESAKKYQELCHSKIANAFDVLMDFLSHVKLTENTYREEGRPFPEIRLSIVDTSEEEFIPESGRNAYEKGNFPVADFDECKKIADNFSWPLIVKRLFRDSRDERWNDRSFEKLCIRGISPDVCHECKYRH